MRFARLVLRTGTQRDSRALFHPSRGGSKSSAVELRAVLFRLRNNPALSLLLKISASLYLFFALALTVHAQVTVSANLTDGTGATCRTAYLHFQLLNCGDNFPAVPSQPGLIIQDSFDIHPTDRDLALTSTWPKIASIGLLKAATHTFLYTKPRLLLLKLPMEGRIVGRSAAATPNHWARVAAYCELAVEGTQRPLEPESSGPARARVG
jgi:hypothetical protein